MPCRTAIQWVFRLRTRIRAGLMLASATDRNDAGVWRRPHEVLLRKLRSASHFDMSTVINGFQSRRSKVVQTGSSPGRWATSFAGVRIGRQAAVDPADHGHRGGSPSFQQRRPVFTRLSWAPASARLARSTHRRPRLHLSAATALPAPTWNHGLRPRSVDQEAHRRAKGSAGGRSPAFDPVVHRQPSRRDRQAQTPPQPGRPPRQSRRPYEATIHVTAIKEWLRALPDTI